MVPGHYAYVKTLLRFHLHNCPLSKISSKFPTLEYLIQEKQVLPKGSVLASLVLKQNGSSDAFFRSLNSNKMVQSLDLLYFGKRYCKARIEFNCRSCMFLTLNEDLGISSDYICYKNGGAEACFSLKDQTEFRDLFKHLKGAGLKFEILEVKRLTDGIEDLSFAGGPVSPSEDLTTKQLEILKHAYYSGYFDRKRKANLGDISEHFELSPATVAVHIRVGLKKILKPHV